jgi:hypothetical protein
MRVLVHHLLGIRVPPLLQRVEHVEGPEPRLGRRELRRRRRRRCGPGPGRRHAPRVHLPEPLPVRLDPHVVANQPGRRRLAALARGGTPAEQELLRSQPVIWPVHRARAVEYAAGFLAPLDDADARLQHRVAAVLVAGVAAADGRGVVGAAELEATRG